jgi:integrase
MFLDSIDLPKGYTFYSWKNTGAVMMYKNGVKMKYISLLMGHSSIEITDIYFKSLGIDDVMNEINIAYPSIGG